MIIYNEFILCVVLMPSQLELNRHKNDLLCHNGRSFLILFLELTTFSKRYIYIDIQLLKTRKNNY